MCRYRSLITEGRHRTSGRRSNTGQVNIGGIMICEEGKSFADSALVPQKYSANIRSDLADAIYQLH